jgi:archaellin
VSIDKSVAFGIGPRIVVTVLVLLVIAALGIPLAIGEADVLEGTGNNLLKEADSGNYLGDGDGSDEGDGTYIAEDTSGSGDSEVRFTKLNKSVDSGSSESFTAVAQVQEQKIQTASIRFGIPAAVQRTRARNFENKDCGSQGSAASSCEISAEQFFPQSPENQGYDATVEAAFQTESGNTLQRSFELQVNGTRSVEFVKKSEGPVEAGEPVVYEARFEAEEPIFEQIELKADPSKYVEGEGKPVKETWTKDCTTQNGEPSSSCTISQEITFPDTISDYKASVTASSAKMEKQIDVDVKSAAEIRFIQKKTAAVQPNQEVTYEVKAVAGSPVINEVNFVVNPNRLSDDGDPLSRQYDVVCGDDDSTFTSSCSYTRQVTFPDQDEEYRAFIAASFATGVSSSDTVTGVKYFGKEFRVQVVS